MYKTRKAKEMHRDWASPNTQPVDALKTALSFTSAVELRSNRAAEVSAGVGEQPRGWAAGEKTLAAPARLGAERDKFTPWLLTPWLVVLIFERHKPAGLLPLSPLGPVIPTSALSPGFFHPSGWGRRVRLLGGGHRCCRPELSCPHLLLHLHPQPAVPWERLWRGGGVSV